jgi:dipeptidyl aminopeptidase/acylaminoacyl peptidase
MRLILLAAAVLIVAISAGAGATEDVARGSARLVVYGLDGWVWRADVDGSDRVRVTRGLFPEVSPDGRWVAFMRRTRTRSLFELRVAALDGRTRRLVRRGRIVGYAWLSDSARLLVHDTREGVLVADRSGGAVTLLAPQVLPQAGAINSVSPAPDATFVVFDRRNTQRSDIFAVPVSGGVERRLTVDGNSLAPIAGPTAVAFTRYVVGRKPREALWLMERDGANQRRLSHAAPRPAFWSADGRRLIAETISLTFSGGWFGKIWVVNVATGVSRPLYKRQIEGLHSVGVSGDGRRVLAVRGCVAWGTLGKATPGKVETISADGGKLRTLVRGPCHARWNA